MTENEKRQHSVLGIVSCVLGSISLLIQVVTISGSGILNFGSAWLYIPGIILGAIGMWQRDENRFFAVLGFVINLIPILLLFYFVLFLY